MIKTGFCSGQSDPKLSVIEGVDSFCCDLCLYIDLFEKYRGTTSF